MGVGRHAVPAGAPPFPDHPQVQIPAPGAPRQEVRRGKRDRVQGHRPVADHQGKRQPGEFPLLPLLLRRFLSCAGLEKSTARLDCISADQSLPGSPASRFILGGRNDRTPPLDSVVSRLSFS